MTFSPQCRCSWLLLLALLARCAAPDHGCERSIVTQMPLEVQDSLLTVPASINGHASRLVVDTGTDQTVISRELVERLALEPDGRASTRAIGVGGATTRTDVKVNGLVLGGVRFPVEHLAVGGLDLHTEAGLDADGLLGPDILLAFDMDIDVPGGKLTLYRARQCAGSRPPWAAFPWASFPRIDPVEITGVRTRRDGILLPIELDGIDAMALLDTGSQRNMVGVGLAERLGLTRQLLSTDPKSRQRGVGPRELAVPMHRFRQLRVGPLLQTAPEISVLPSEAGFGEALIGEEFLRGRRVWIAFRNRQVFVSRRVGEPRAGVP